MLGSSCCENQFQLFRVLHVSPLGPHSTVADSARESANMGRMLNQTHATSEGVKSSPGGAIAHPEGDQIVCVYEWKAYFSNCNRVG